MVQSLSRGIQLIEAIARSNHGLTLTELANKVGLANSTTHRLLKTIELEGLIYQDLANERWLVSGKLFHLGSAFARTRDLLEIATPVMKHLMLRMGETVNICVMDDSVLEAVLVGQVQCLEIMRMVSPIGSKLPIHASAAGKILLSNYRDEELKGVFGEKYTLEKYTSNTLQTVPELIDEIRKVKNLQYAMDNEEQFLSLRCVASAVYDENHQIIAAISVSGPLIRMNDEKTNLAIHSVKEAANEISKRYTKI
ncbi:IclR family transcriptional regulator domain-containing protein [Thorsellia kenyensis]|uniref:HTH-type transcriptional repressor AllR n=1 Tax=Thorsellia kenyensis TaxID=1549888 RepID=A0ABV6C7K5_9GAMM